MLPIVNVATGCGFTPQCKDLQQTYSESLIDHDRNIIRSLDQTTSMNKVSEIDGKALL